MSRRPGTAAAVSDGPQQRRRSIELAEGLALPLEAVTETFAILANRGSGKSATAHRLVEQMHQAGLPVVAIDVKGDWWGIRSSADGKGPGLPFVIFGGDHGDVPLESTAGELLADLIVDDRVPAVLDLSHMSKSKARAFATSFAERLYVRNRDALHVVIEEADVLIPQRATADTARLLGAMEDIAKRGRSRGIGLTVVTQRPQEVAKSVLELMETVVLLRMTGPRSIKAAQDWISVNAAEDDTQAREVIGSLPALKTGEGWVWSPAFLRLLERVQITMFGTYDSHATPKPGQARVVPKGRADIDLEKLGAEIAATVERARAHDPKALQARLRALESKLAAASAHEQQLTDRIHSYEDAVAAKDTELAELRARTAELEARRPDYPPHLAESLGSAAHLIQEAIEAISEPGPPSQAAARSVTPAIDPTGVMLPAGRATEAETSQRATPGRDRTRTSPTPSVSAGSPPPADHNTDQSNGTVTFRAGAQRMLESLGRMAPLRLTKTQWGTVAKMKSRGGTFGTYLGELRRAGLIDENHVGFTLTDDGFDYLGGRPASMTAQELQQHYLSILRGGAARMLQAVMDAYPSGLSKDEISAKVDIAVTGGTFGTYLGELRRNGLIEQRGTQFVASATLMQGAAATQI